MADNVACRAKKSYYGVGGGAPFREIFPLDCSLHQPRNMTHLQISRSVIKYHPDGIKVQRFSGSIDYLWIVILWRDFVMYAVPSGVMNTVPSGFNFYLRTWLMHPSRDYWHLYLHEGVMPHTKLITFLYGCFGSPSGMDFPVSLNMRKLWREISDRHRLRETSWQTIPTLPQPKSSELSFCYVTYTKENWMEN